MNRILFYLQYAARNLWRNRRWSAFAIFSVAAGVATVVALRSLGLAIGDSLTSNVRASNHGDITIQRSGTAFMGFRDPEDERVFERWQLDQVQNWLDANGGSMTAYIVSGNVQLTALDFQTVGRPQFISTLFIDPATYPPTDDIRAVDPPGARLPDLLHPGSNEVVVSENLAESQGIEVGDRVRASGSEIEFTVTGIVPTTAEAGFRNIFAAFFGFAYFDMSQIEQLPVATKPNNISLTLADGTPPEAIREAAETLSDMLGTGRGGRLRVITAPDLLEQNRKIADVMGSFIVVLGLGALLIGGVGIINTMLVMVRRRTEEIAALKTFGLKGRQVAALFLSEALLLGIIGSVVGGVFGVLLSGLANAYGATLIQQPLVWRFYPDAVLFGLVLGIVVTVVFGVMPVLTAVKVRPGIILRPNETHIPRVGLLQSLGVVMIVVVTIGLIAGQIMAPTFALIDDAPARISRRVSDLPVGNPFVVGIIGVGATLLILALLVGILWIVVWLVGKMPAFGSVDLRLALRNLSTRRIRTATTLLALSAGMFALSSITFFGAGAREILQVTLSDTFGGNVVILPILPPAISQPLIDFKLNQLADQVQYRTRFMNFRGEIFAIDGQSLGSLGQRPVDVETLNRQLQEALEAGDEEQARVLNNQLALASFDRYVGIIVRDTDNPAINSGDLLAGRDLTLDDRGKRVLVVKRTPALAVLGVTIGSTLRIQINDLETYDFEVVGLLPETSFENFQSSFVLGDMLMPPDAIPTRANEFQLNVIQVEPEYLNNVLLELSSLPLIYSLDISFIDGLLARIINQMSAIPILVGLLSLGAAAVIMANTVALATLERRRQIGILKAVGLKGQRVMRIMMLENTLVSLLGAVLGLGLSGLGVVIITHFGLSFAILVPSDALPAAIALVVAAVFIGWLATVLSARVAVRERVLNVLRYE